MRFSRNGRHRLVAVGLLMLSAAGFAGCAPEAEPTPTPTAAFSSEEEAFAAAEEVYRAYIDASNAVDFQDPSTFEPLSEYAGGDYLADERKQLSEMHANGYIRGGTIEVIDFYGVAYDDATTVAARTCNDVSATTFTDADGNNLVPADRADRYALDLTFTVTSDALYLVAAEAVEDVTCAS